MTFEELEARVKCGRYDPPPKPRKPLPDTHVIDENKSVKWNRDQVKRLNDTADKERMEYLRKKSQAAHRFTADCQSAIRDWLGDLEQVGPLVFQCAWDEGHAYGYMEVLRYARKYCEIVENVLRVV